MNKKEAQYRRAFILTAIGGLILISLGIASIILIAEDDVYGNYGSSEADTFVIMIIVTAVAIGMWIFGMGHYQERWIIAHENKQIPYECEHCDKIRMIPEIEQVEQLQDHYFKCEKCGRMITRKRTQ